MEGASVKCKKKDEKVILYLRDGLITVLEDYQYSIIEKLSRRFAVSKFAKDLTELEEESVAFICETILNYAWTEKETTPEKLNEDALKDVLTDILPRKAILHEEAFKFVPKIVSGMLRYFQDIQLLPEGIDLSEKVLVWSDEIIANGFNRELWDEGKIFSIEALEKGFDLDDPDTFRDLTPGYNELVDVSDQHDDYPESDYTPNIPIKEYTKKIGRNQPCPCGSGRKYKKCCGQVNLN